MDHALTALNYLIAFAQILAALRRCADTGKSDSPQDILLARFYAAKLNTSVPRPMFHRQVKATVGRLKQLAMEPGR